MTRSQAIAVLQRVAAGVDELTEHERLARLLERVSVHEDAPALRDALVELGAAVLVHGARP
jgi:hypothetical protein